MGEPITGETGRMLRRRSSRFVVLAAVAAAAGAGLLAGCSAITGTDGASCRSVSVPVHLPTGESAQIAGTYCEPDRSAPTTVVMAVHGGTYNRDYWTWSQDSGKYNFTNKAVAAGYAVLAVDRLGDGQSTRPVSTHDTAAAQVSTLHQVIQAARSGQLGVGYRQVLWVGHSFGSYYGVALTSQYPHDVDAMVLTGFGAHVSAATNTINAADFEPARNLARFSTLDDGYVTNKPNTRADQLADGPNHAPPNEDPAVIAYDQATEDVLANSELTTRPASLAPMMTKLPDIPILVMDGNQDEHYCEPDVYNCASTSGWLTAEASSFPATACLAGQLEPSGHDIQLSYASVASDTAILSWANTSLPPHAPSSRCAVRGPIATAGIRLDPVSG